MRVHIHLSKYYDWDPVPPDVKLTQAEIDGPLIVAGKDPGTYRMRVMKDGPTVRTCMISEATVLGAILYEKLDVRRSGATINRKQAVAQVVQLLLEDGAKRVHAEWCWITGFAVEDDGPDAQAFQTAMDPHMMATHGRRGTPHLTADSLDAHRAAYHEPADADAHVAHLKAHFGVKAT